MHRSDCTDARFNQSIPFYNMVLLFFMTILNQLNTTHLVFRFQRQSELSTIQRSSQFNSDIFFRPPVVVHSVTVYIVVIGLLHLLQLQKFVIDASMVKV